MERLRAVDPDDSAECNRVSQELASFVRTCKLKCREKFSLELLQGLFDRIVSFTDVDSWKRAYSEYSIGGKLEIAIEAFRLHLVAAAQTVSNAAEWLDAFEGNRQIPMMTVHKSKGLEYHTVMFVGLDDDAWWSPASTGSVFRADLGARTHHPRQFHRLPGNHLAEMYQPSNALSRACSN